MTATVRDAGPHEKLVTFQVGESEIETAKTLAARRLSRELKLKGFRPGKAPRPVVEAAVGSQRLRSEAIEDLLPEKVAEVLSEVQLEPAVSPSLEDLRDTPEGVEVDVRVTLWPTLSQTPAWRDREVVVSRPEVTDEEVDAQIERMQEQFAQLETVERPAGEGDFVDIDISATHEGEPVEEATAAGLLYEVGSGRFLEGIDEHLLGAEAGSSVEFQGTLPEGFGEKAGLEVTFRVTVNEVKAKALPELTDEWVAEVSEYDTIEELRGELRQRMAELKKRAALTEFRNKALEQLVEELEVDLPEPLIRAEMDEVLHRFVHRLEQQGISLEDYFRVTGVEQSTLVADVRAQAEASLKTRLLLDAVAEEEGLTVTDEELEGVLQAVARSTDQPEQFLRAVRGTPREESLRGDILRDKALDVVVTAARAVDEEGEPVDLTIEDRQPPLVAGEVEAEIVEAEVVGEVVGEPLEESHGIPD